MRVPTLLLVIFSFAYTATACPIYAFTGIESNGALRPRAMITRRGDIINTGVSSSSSGPTGSTSTSCSLIGCASAAQSGSQGSTSTATSSCTILGGCSSSASAACPAHLNGATVVNPATASLCGDGKSTDSETPGFSHFLATRKEKIERAFGWASTAFNQQESRMPCRDSPSLEPPRSLTAGSSDASSTVMASSERFALMPYDRRIW